MGKSFQSHKDNGVFLQFPNGNGISTIWGKYTYSDNKDIDYNTPFETRLDSNTAEILIKCSDKLHKRIHKKYNGDGNIIGFLNIKQWLEILNLLEKENPLQNRK